MTNVKRIGGALIGAAMGLVGCAGGATGVETASLQEVDATVDGRTDMFLDSAQAPFLLTADQVNGSPTAVAVDVHLTSEELILWHAGTAHVDANLVGRFPVVQQGAEEGVDLSTAVAIDNETHPGDPSTIVLPGGALGGLRGTSQQGSRSAPPLHIAPPDLDVHLIIDFGSIGGIPDQTDVDLYHNVVGAHPGCA